MDAETRAALLAIVRAEAFKTIPNQTMEQNAFNFAEKIYLFVKTGAVANGKAHEDAGKVRRSE
jgi:hypothetical protein